jgi:hypothetical protein
LVLVAPVFLGQGPARRRDRSKQAWLLKQYLPHGMKLRITDVKEMFVQMMDQE